MVLSELAATKEKLFVNSYARKLHHGKEQKYCLPISGQPSLYELCGVGFLTEAVWHNTRGVDRKFLLKFFRHSRQKTLNDFCTTHPVRQSSHNLKIGRISQSGTALTSNITIIVIISVITSIQHHRYHDPDQHHK